MELDELEELVELEELEELDELPVTIAGCNRVELYRQYIHK